LTSTAGLATVGPVTTTLSATVTLDPDFHRGTIDRRLFGSFLEHMGRAVYHGVYEPDHPTADEFGFRRDVQDLIAELGTTLVRYPGGNFVSGYDWTHGIGPVADRPRDLELAWHSIETNEVGTDEFLRWADRTAIEPMMAVNLGTAGIAEAVALLEYTNLPTGTRWADRRSANGHPDPYGVPLWCLGNEMDGPWQTGHLSAAEYGSLADRVGRAMKSADPTIELVAVGSSSHQMATYATWEQTVLESCFDVHHLSLHAYYAETGGDRRSFLASGADMDAFIKEVVSIADAVAGRRRSRKRIGLSFDEWNVCYHVPGEQRERWEIAAPRGENDYSALDAVVVGDLLVTLLNNSDRVPIACFAQLVNTIAPIMTENAADGGASWRQTTFHPIALTAAAARGHSLQAAVRAPVLDTARHGEVPLVSAAATHDPETGRVTVFCVNRGEEPVRLSLRHHGFGSFAADSATTLRADDAGARRGAAATAEAAPVALTGFTTDGATSTVELPPESWTMLGAASSPL